MSRARRASRRLSQKSDRRTGRRFSPTRLGGSFNPNTIFPLGDAGLVYRSRTVLADWGQLTAHGHLRAWRGRRSRSVASR